MSMLTVSDIPLDATSPAQRLRRMAAAQHSGSNPLFQFFHVERNLVFHCGPFFCSLVSLGTSGPTLSSGIGGPAGIRRPVHRRQTPTRCLGELCRYQ